MTTYTFSDELFSDLHKDAYGYRPRGEWHRWQAMTDEAKQSWWNSMCQTIDREEAERREEEDAARVRLVAILDRYAAAGVTGDDALRALHDVYETDGDDEYLDYQLGVAYGTIGRMRQDRRDAQEAFELGFNGGAL
jgi:hypothetical protein